MTNVGQSGDKCNKDAWEWGSNVGMGTSGMNSCPCVTF